MSVLGPTHSLSVYVLETNIKCIRNKHTHTQTYTHTHTHIHTHAHTHTHTHIHTHKHTRTHPHKHTHTHTCVGDLAVSAAACITIIDIIIHHILNIHTYTAYDAYIYITCVGDLAVRTATCITIIDTIIQTNNTNDAYILYVTYLYGGPYGTYCGMCCTLPLTPLALLC
jgi:hypothetical protein